MAIKWQARLQRGEASLRNNGTEDFNKWEGLRFPDQSKIIEGPIPGGWNALRLEVKYGDKDPRYSDQRVLLSGPMRGVRVDAGQETWTRWKQMWPSNWIGVFPKWDQLYDWPNIQHSGGSTGEWHHAPLDENWDNFGGSAPIYMGASDKEVTLRVNKWNGGRDGGSPDKSYTLAQLQRGHWYDHVVHGVWSTDPAKGLLEVFIDGKLVATHHGSVLWPGMYNWFLLGLYRNVHIGAPDLVWPAGAKNGIDYKAFTPVTGQRVFPNDDGYPQQTYVTGMAIGESADDVWNLYPATDAQPTPTPVPPAPPSPSPIPSPVPAPTPTPPPVGTYPPPEDSPLWVDHPKARMGLQQLIKQRVDLETLLSRSNVSRMELLSTCDRILQETRTVLNLGKW